VTNQTAGSNVFPSEPDIDENGVEFIVVGIPDRL
jgi:hypothetical protein